MKNKLILSFLFILASLSLPSSVFASTPTLKQLNSSLLKAQRYYNGLYKDLGSKGAVVNEYYSSPGSAYTIRHATIGGIYYYDYIGDATKSGKLKKFVADYGFNPADDLHSLIWTKTNTAPANNVYSLAAYHDCDVSLPAIGNEFPYHSKVCKLGKMGTNLYILATKFDTLVPIINDLQILEQGGVVDPKAVKSLEQKYDTLGNGMPICTPLSCAKVASAIRTAEFGELELRLGNKKYADLAAADLMKAQNDQGAVYFSYDAKGNLKDVKPFIYQLLIKLLNDNPIFKGFIPSNAETMNDVLAFILHFRCIRYGICQSI